MSLKGWGWSIIIRGCLSGFDIFGLNLPGFKISRFKNGHAW